MYPLVEGQGAQCVVGLGNVSPWVRVSSGGGCPRPWVKWGLGLGLGVLNLAYCGWLCAPLLGVLLSWVGLVQVDPWVRVDTGGGCPRPWGEEG